MKQWAVRSMRSHCLATLIAVSILSPVHIILRMSASLSSLMTPVVAGFSLFSKMMKPRNSRSDSASWRVILLTLAQLSVGICLVAHAITRKPLWV